MFDSSAKNFYIFVPFPYLENSSLHEKIESKERELQRFGKIMKLPGLQVEIMVFLMPYKVHLSFSLLNF